MRRIPWMARGAVLGALLVSSTAVLCQESAKEQAALAKAFSANKGYGAVSATATLKDGKAVAEITLIKGTQFKTVTQPLS